MATSIWYWSLVALVLAIVLVSVVGLLARYYVGKRLIAWLDSTLLRVPLLNKIYTTIKQVNEAFSSGKKSSFKTVVLVEFPARRNVFHRLHHQRTAGRSADQDKGKSGLRVHSHHPNPTSGFLVLVPEDKITKLDMSVADGIKYIISLGSISPEYEPPPDKKLRAADRPLAVP